MEKERVETVSVPCEIANVFAMAAGWNDAPLCCVLLTEQGVAAHVNKMFAQRMGPLYKFANFERGSLRYTHL